MPRWYQSFRLDCWTVQEQAWAHSLASNCAYWYTVGTPSGTTSASVLHFPCMHFIGKQNACLGAENCIYSFIWIYIDISSLGTALLSWTTYFTKHDPVLSYIQQNKLSWKVSLENCSCTYAVWKSKTEGDRDTDILSETNGLKNKIAYESNKL